MNGALSASARRRVTEGLKTIWHRREIPFIPEQELRRVTDRDLAYLLRYWSHVDRYWDVDNAPPFREEPPQGYDKMFAPVRTPAGDIIGGGKPEYSGRGTEGTGGSTPNSHHVFKSTGGGYLTFRQSLKLRTAAY